MKHNSNIAKNIKDQYVLLLKIYFNVMGFFCVLCSIIINNNNNNINNV